jgi:hypothetical protein
MTQLRQHAVRTLLVVAMVCGGMHHAAADRITNDFGLQNPQQHLRFSELPLSNGQAVTTQYAAYGVTFSPHLFHAQFSAPDPWPHVSGGAVANNGIVDPFSIQFTQDQTAAAFAMVTNTGISVFTALLDGQVVDQFSTVTSTVSSNNYYGFSNILFDEIRVGVGGFNNAMVLDNLETTAAPAPVPEPGTLLLMGTGLLSLLGYGWQKRHQTA